MKQLLALLALALLASTPASAACTARGCVVGPCMAYDVVVDFSFNDGCSAWKWASSAHRVYIKGWAAQFDMGSPSGRVYQDIDITGYELTDITLTLDVEKCTTGAETLYIELRRPSDDALLERVATLPASSTSSGAFSFPLLRSYAGSSSVRLAIRQVGGTGDTEFRLKDISLWAAPGP